jgi:putative phage-type endonuclease
MDKDQIGLSKVKFLKNLPQHVQKSEEWLNQRKGRLTSSDGATALGINPYEKPIKLVFKKCGLHDKFTGNEATKHGERYESEAIRWYCKLMNKTNYEFGLIDYAALAPVRKPSKLDTIPHDTSFLAGSPDGVAVDNDGREDAVLLEVKCPMRRKLKFGYIPEYYYPQVQLNMAILDIDKADFIEYIPANDPNVAYGSLSKPLINIVRVHRNDDWLVKNIAILYELWKQVLYWREVGILNHPEYHKKQNDSDYDDSDTEFRDDTELRGIEFRDE